MRFRATGLGWSAVLSALALAHVTACSGDSEPTGAGGAGGAGGVSGSSGASGSSTGGKGGSPPAAGSSGSGGSSSGGSGTAGSAAGGQAGESGSDCTTRGCQPGYYCSACLTPDSVVFVCIPEGAAC